MLNAVLVAALVVNVNPGENLADVRDRIRYMDAAEKARGVEVVLAPGRYICEPGALAFTGEDSGTKQGAVIWRGDPEGGTVVSQGVEIPLRKFRLQRDRTDGVKVIVADLGEYGFSLGKSPNREMTYPLPIPEVYVDGTRMVPARWPNEGWATIDSIIDGGTKAGTGGAWEAISGRQTKSDEPPRGGKFVSKDPRVRRWAKSRDVWLHGYWCFDWSESVIPVETIDAEHGVFTLKYPHCYGVRKGNPNARRWRAVNLYEELDVPGEFYVDREKQLLYLCPPAGFNPGSRVAFLDCRGRDLVRCEGVSNLVFRNIRFEEGYGSGAVLRDCERVAFDRCAFRNLRQRAVTMEGCRNCVVRGASVHQTGAGGIVLGGGNRRTLEPGRNRAEDCVIRDFSVQRLVYAPAIALNGVGNVARNNEISSAPHMAVGIYGNDHVFELNVVSNVCTSSDDAGGLYKGRNPSCRGNVIRWNYWRDVGSPQGHGTAAIYFDDGDGGDHVVGNLFVNCGVPGKGSFGTIFSHGGYDNDVRNNIFVRCARPLGSAPWKQERWTQCLRSEFWLKRLKEEVDVTSETYLRHYPELNGFLGPHPDAQRWNHASRNAFVDCPEISSGRWDVDKTNAKILADPGFKDVKAGDYSLKRTSRVYSQIKGFEQIPFERIGLLTKEPERKVR